MHSVLFESLKVTTAPISNIIDATLQVGGANPGTYQIAANYTNTVQDDNVSPGKLVHYISQSFDLVETPSTCNDDNSVAIGPLGRRVYFGSR